MLLDLLSHIFLTENVTIYFLKAIIHRQKKYLKNDQVKTLYVPQYEGLAIKDILEFASDKPQVEYYLPEDIELTKIPK